MIQVPTILKAEKDLTGRIAVTFKGDEGEFSQAFSEFQGGISWPLRTMLGYLCIIGLFSGAIYGAAGSMMHVYEKQYPSSMELIQDAYNRAKDLRFSKFFTDMRRVEWQGFNFEFQRQIRLGMGSTDIRLAHSPFAHDFMMGLDTIRRIAAKKMVQLPTASILMNQLIGLTPKDIESETPENKFNAINAYRYLAVANDLMRNRPKAAFPPGVA